MNKAIISFLVFGILLFLANVLRLLFGYVSIQKFGIGLQLLVLASFWLTYSLYRKPEMVKWFGKSVDANSYANITIGKCFNLGFALFGFLLSLGRLLF